MKKEIPLAENPEYTHHEVFVPGKYPSRIALFVSLVRAAWKKPDQSFWQKTCQTLDLVVIYADGYLERKHQGR